MSDIESAKWIGSLVVLGLVALLHRVQQFKRRRTAHWYKIPNFLCGTNEPPASADSRFKGNWAELHPLPERTKGDE